MNHIATAMDRMIADQERRHQWLFRAGQQIRRMNEEERISTKGAGAKASDR